jgi:hypothetical protein
MPPVGFEPTIPASAKQSKVENENEKVVVRIEPNVLRKGRKYSLRVCKNAVSNQFVFQGL